MHVFKLDIKDDELLQENQLLRNDFDHLKSLTEIWFEERISFISRIAQLEAKIRDM